MGRDLLVLSDSVIHNLLISLSKQEIITFQESLSKALIDFTVGKERLYQPTPDFINRPSGQKTLFRAFTSPTTVGTKIIVTPAHEKDASGVVVVHPPLRGVLTLCDAAGFPTSLINAEEVTGYRTTLSALIPYMWRQNTEHVVIFGAGKQGLWHARMVLALRGSEIRKVTVVNRSLARAKTLVQQVKEENAKYWQSTASLEVLDTTREDYSEALAILLSAADAVFCTVGTTNPIFSLKTILGTSTRNRQPFVSAIGSWQKEMIELDPEILQYAAKSCINQRNGGGGVLVDDLDETLIKSGEVIQSGLRKDQLLEVGRILSWQRGDEGALPNKRQEQLKQWLSDGFVVYKGIGVSVTDLAAGNVILAMARAHNVGVPIPNF